MTERDVHLEARWPDGSVTYLWVKPGLLGLTLRLYRDLGADVAEVEDDAGLTIGV